MNLGKTLKNSRGSRTIGRYGDDCTKVSPYETENIDLRQKIQDHTHVLVLKDNEIADLKKNYTNDKSALGDKLKKL